MYSTTTQQSRKDTTMPSEETTPVIIAAKRTPVGRFLGGLSRVPAPQLGAWAIEAALKGFRGATLAKSTNVLWAVFCKQALDKIQPGKQPLWQVCQTPFQLLPSIKCAAVDCNQSCRHRNPIKAGGKQNCCSWRYGKHVHRPTPCSRSRWD